MIDNLLIGLNTVFEISNLTFGLFGTILGIIIGAIPGLTATMGVALLVPVTFVLPPVTGLIMLSGIYCGAIYGGSVSAILLHAPGTPASICTMKDGYVLTTQGRAKEALSLAILASFIGGIFSSIALIFFSPLLANFALKFGPFEYFALCIFGMSMIVTISSDDVVKGIISGIIGLLIATIGSDPARGFPRYYFGVMNIYSGLELVPVLIGLFALPEAFKLIIQGGTDKRKIGKLKGRLLPPANELLKKWFLFIKSSIIGVFIGIIPAIGPVVAPFVSYNEAQRTSKDPDLFGKGNIDGIIASEAANNGVTGASLIPLITLGIPGSAVAAVFLGGLTIHGLRPGPMLFIRNPEVVYGLLVGFLVVNIFMFIAGISGARLFAKVSQLPTSIIASFIILFSMLGSFAIRNSAFDIWIVLFFGVVGYLINRLNFAPGPIVLGLVLGPILENNLIQSLQIARGSILPFVTRPITVLFLILSILSIVFSFINIRKKRQSS